MKKILIGLSLLAFAALPVRVFAAESIVDYVVTIWVNADSTLTVSEEIVYDFGLEYRHGIFRDIPYKYQRNQLNYNLRITDISVTDASGHTYQFKQSKNDGKLNLKIGDPN